MATYPAGDITKEKLYSTAKQLFYKKGYYSTTMKEVCEIAGIKQSVFYYHYKNKNELAKRLYTDFGERHSGAIGREIIKNGYRADIITANCVCTALYFLNTMADEHLNKFWAEMYLDNVPSYIEFYRHRYRNMYKRRGFDPNDSEFDFFIVSCTSINGPLLMGYYDGSFKASPEDIAIYKTKHTLRNLRMNEADVEKRTVDIMDIASKINITAGENFSIYLNGTNVEELAPPGAASEKIFM